MARELDISHLTPAERLQLIDKLWDSLSDKDIPVPPEHMEELNRRLEAEARGEMTFSPWEEVKQRLFL
jgi:putative addiction module component (TIGR02574 family)